METYVKFQSVSDEQHKLEVLDGFMKALREAESWCPQARSLRGIIKNTRLLRITPYKAVKSNNPNSAAAGQTSSSYSSSRSASPLALTVTTCMTAAAISVALTGHNSVSISQLTSKASVSTILVGSILVVSSLLYAGSRFLQAEQNEAPKTPVQIHSGEHATSNLRVSQPEVTPPPPSALDGNLYILMVVGHQDFVLEKLGKDHGFPRGFPVLWEPGKRIQMAGFRPKFANYDRDPQSASSTKAPSDLQGIGCFKKWSGYLGQLVAFEYQGKACWTATSKNGASNPFADDAARLFSSLVTPRLLKELIAQRLHFCAEMMSSMDQTHGARVHKETPVITALGSGVWLDLETKQANGGGAKKGVFVDFAGFRDTIAFCVEFGLPVDSAILCTGVASKAMYEAVSAEHDTMNNTRFDEIIRDLEKKYPDRFQIIKGTVSHKNILGETLEGLVLHEVLHNDDNLTNDIVISKIEGHSTEIVKFKFPRYTIRTMCLREALGNNNKRPKMMLPQFDNFAMSWAKRWCTTDKGRVYWHAFAWEAMVLNNESEAEFADATREQFDVGLHIRLAEHIIKNGIRQDIQSIIKKHTGMKLRLKENIVILAPFAKLDRITAIALALKEVGIECMLQKGKPKSAYYASIATMYQPSNLTGKICFELPNPPESEMMEWQINKSKTWPADRPTIRVASLSALVPAIKAKCASDGPKLAFDPQAEARLQQGSKRAEQELVAKLEESSVPIVIMLVGPQCIGKSSICAALSDKGAVQCSADIHMKQLGGFFPGQLSKCHEACQMDCLNAVAAGKSAVVDNTNMSEAHRTLYYEIATVLGARCVSYAISPELWLDCNPTERSTTIDVLTARAFRRKELGGDAEFDISRKVIKTTIDRAVRELHGRSVSEWLKCYPKPTHMGGYCDHRGCLVYRSRDLNDWAAKLLEEERVKEHPGIERARLRHAIQRGQGEYHITILNSKERSLLTRTPKKALPKGGDHDIEMVGCGRAEHSESGDWVLFGVVKWPTAQKFRESLGLPPHDFHVTLAFSNKDLHGIPKNETTMEW